MKGERLLFAQQRLIPTEDENTEATLVPADDFTTKAFRAEQSRAVQPAAEYLGQMSERQHCRDLL